MNNIAIIPARCGSKGLKDKNIKELNGIPLIAYSINAAKASGIFDEIMVSTDSSRYAEIAVQYGASVPFLRSKDMSSDTAGSWGVVKEVLTKYRQKEMLFDTVCLLQPTSPLRQAEDILGCYELLEKMEADAVTSVCEMDHSPLWSMTLPDNHSLVEYRKSQKYNVTRQMLDKYYRLNGAVYIRKILYESAIDILDSNEYAYVMKRRRSVDIDTEEDFELAEFLISRR